MYLLHSILIILSFTESIGSVIDYDQFFGFIILAQEIADGMGNKLTPVIGGGHDTINQRQHFIFKCCLIHFHLHLSPFFFKFPFSYLTHYLSDPIFSEHNHLDILWNRKISGESKLPGVTG
jgi:hypothetical protein